MNERIRELKQQAADYVDSIDNGIGIEEYRKLLDQKFAELIVKEMLKTCEEHPAWTGRMIGEQIKQHFGVEE